MRKEEMKTVQYEKKGEEMRQNDERRRDIWVHIMRKKEERKQDEEGR